VIDATFEEVFDAKPILTWQTSYDDAVYGALGAKPVAISKTKEALREIAAALKALDDKRRYRCDRLLLPYPKQQEFFDAGGMFAERLLSAGNQQGKTQAAPRRWRTTSPGNILTTGWAALGSSHQSLGLR
jgi:hypothetical protein